MIRKIMLTEIEEVKALRNYSFSSEYTGERLKDFEYWVEKSDSLGSFINEKLVGQLMILPLNMTIGDINMSMGGIGFVATYPEYRNRGIVKKLMIEALQTMRKNKQAISILAPFSVPFYRHFGWEIFNDVLEFEITSQQFPRLSKSLDDVVRMTFDNIDDLFFEQVKQFHNEFAEKTNGLMKRSDMWWNRIISRQPKSVIMAVYNDDVITGYMRYEIIGTDFIMEDFYTEDYETEQAIWRFIVAHQASVTMIKGSTKVQRKLAVTFNEPQISRVMKQKTMLRIVDIELFVNQLNLNIADEIFLNIIDAFAPWNEGLFVINSDGMSKVEYTKHEILHIEINWLAPLFAGYLTIDDLCYLKIISISHELYMRLKAVFSSEPLFFNEYF